MQCCYHAAEQSLLDNKIFLLNNVGQVVNLLTLGLGDCSVVRNRHQLGESGFQFSMSLVYWVEQAFLW